MKEIISQELKPSWSELHAMILATSEQMKETDRRLKKLFKETDERIIRTSKQIEETNKRYGGFTNEFGKMIENLCRRH